MVIYLNEAGGVLSVPASVPMGSSLRNVTVIAPKLSQTLVLKVMPPSQERLPDIICQMALGTENNAVYTAKLPSAVTKCAGRAEYQLVAHSPDGEGIPSDIGSFNVTRGVITNMPDTVEQLENYSLDQIYELLASIISVSEELEALIKGTTNYVKNTDYGSIGKAGVVGVKPGCGISIDNTGFMSVNAASEADINKKEDKHNPIVPANLDCAVKSVTYDKAEIDNLSKENKKYADDKVASITPDNIYANAIKVTKSGSMINFDDVSPIPHKISVRVGLQNYVPYPYHSTNGVTAHGITFTINPDKSVTLNGTATGTAIFYLWAESNGTPAPFTLGDFTVGSAGDRQGDVNIYVVYTDANTGSKIYKPSGSDFFLDDTRHTLNFIQIQVAEGKTFNNYTIYPIVKVQGIAEGSTVYGEITRDIALEQVQLTVGENLEYDSGTIKWLYAPSGVLLECSYNKDINKVIENLTQAIISLGGNI